MLVATALFFLVLWINDHIIQSIYFYDNCVLITILMWFLMTLLQMNTLYINILLHKTVLTQTSLNAHNHYFSAIFTLMSKLLLPHVLAGSWMTIKR